MEINQMNPTGGSSTKQMACNLEKYQYPEKQRLRSYFKFKEIENYVKNHLKEE